MLLRAHGYTLAWCGLLFILSAFFLGCFFFHIFVVECFVLNLDLFVSSSYSLSLTLLSNFQTSVFSFSVCIIALTVFTFNVYYMASTTKLTYFLWLTFLFVSSILILINFADLFFVMLGWDGLGVVSFFLILFYQSGVSLSSAAITIIINRLGDALLVLVIVILGLSNPFLGFVVTTLPSGASLWLLALGLITKSALFPFSPWLPAAIAAPTPISSLVHSSTLVTAGLYLIIRNYSLLATLPKLLEVLTIVSLFTSLYAGLNALSEVDTKKIVALSTLSHLGFIGFALGLGWCALAILHLLAHAFFKSTLFIAIGSFISTHWHYQDSRYFSSFSISYPLASSVILVSEASLIGFPFLGGFYSKDFVLESFSYSPLSCFLVCVVYLNLFLTFSYSFRVLSTLFTPPRSSSLVLTHPEVFSFSASLGLLSGVSILFSSVFLSTSVLPVFYVPISINLLPFVFLLVSWFVYIQFLNFSPYYRSLSIYYLSTMLYLAPFWTSSYTNLTTLGYKYQRAVEQGLLYSLVGSNLGSFALHLSSMVIYLYNISLQLSSVYTLIFLILVLVLLV